MSIMSKAAAPAHNYALFKIKDPEGTTCVGFRDVVLLRDCLSFGLAFDALRLDMLRSAVLHLEVHRFDAMHLLFDMHCFETLLVDRHRFSIMRLSSAV